MSRIASIDDYLDELYRHLAVEPRRARRILAEVEDHLREATEEAVRGGAEPGLAAIQAIERFGGPEKVARRFVASPGERLLPPGADPLAFLDRSPDRPRLAIERVTKVYRGGTVANDEVSLSIEPGEVFGLLGPNGAGKTTLVNQVMGLLKPTSGSIRLGQTDLVADPDAARASCSYLPQSDPPIGSVKVAHAIELIARIRGADARQARRRRDELVAALEIEPWRDKLGSAISGGVRRLAGFAMAAVQPGQLVILDEPTNDVDPLRRRLLWREVRRLADGGSTVLLVTHNVLEAEQAVDRLAIIDGGRVVASGTPSSLKQDGKDTVRLLVSLDPLGNEPLEPPFAQHLRRAGRRLIISLRETDATHAMRWARDLIEAGIAEEYQIGAATLEDTYVRLVGRADAAELDQDEVRMSAQAEHTIEPGMAVGRRRAQSGVRWWLRSYWLMAQWDVASLRLTMPAILAVQIVLYCGMIIALGLFYEDIPALQAAYFATGGTVMAMVTIGMTFVPGIISQRKADGSYDYLCSLPVPRLAMLLATLTVFTLVALPGAAIALGVAVLRYDLSLDVSPLLLPVALLVLLTAASLGVAIGHFSGSPVITGAISNLMFVVIFLFSPLNYPADRLPGWYQVVHDWLPFEHMANAVRGSLVSGFGEDMGRSILTLAIWAAAGWVVTYQVLRRRR